ncbi:DUF2933 domain-containing protein [Variovorax sp. RT4R15]|uniref:DUF2933 domain-containing protein n=1 Tax=Variovorax sp. RT4R15 TaxID=3443737 RepID=UPI003F46011E
METQSSEPSFWLSAGGDALLVLVLIGGFFLYTEHRAHLFGMLPYLLVLAWPLMHVCMHHGHPHGGSRSGRFPSEDDL